MMIVWILADVAAAPLVPVDQVFDSTYATSLLAQP
jgi:hypothetical protein